MRVGILLLLILLGGCAALKEGRAAGSSTTAASSSEATCVKETSVGSRIGATRCRSARQIEQEESAANRALDQMRSGANSPNANP